MPASVPTPIASPASLVDAAHLSDARVEDVVRTYLHDARDERVQMAVEWGAFQAGVGVASSIVGRLGGIPGIVAATTVGTLGGIALGLHGANRHMEGQDRFMTAYLAAAIGGFGAFACATLGHAYGLGPALLSSVGCTMVAPVAGAGARMGQNRKAENDLHELEQELDRATELDRIVLADLRQQERRQQGDSGHDHVIVDDQQVIVGGIRIPKGAPRS